MDNKLRELSKPVAWVTMQREFCDDERTVSTNKIEADKYSLLCYDLTPLYSQEYVSVMLAEFEAKDKRIAELETIRAAAEKLVRCKGRYHSEQNYRALAALFGVTTPDLSPIEGDGEAVITELESYNAKLREWNAGLAQESYELQVKLTTPVRLPEGTGWQSDPYNHGRNDGIHQCADAIRAAGFTVEGDE